MINNPFVDKRIRSLSKGDLYYAKTDILCRISPNFYALSQVSKKSIIIITDLVFFEGLRHIEAVDNGKIVLIEQEDFVYFCEKIE